MLAAGFVAMSICSQPYTYFLLCQGRRGWSQSGCPTKTDRAPATEIADRVGRSVGAQRVRRLFTPPSADFERKPDENQPFFAQKSPSLGCLQGRSACDGVRATCGRTTPYTYPQNK